MCCVCACVSRIGAHALHPIAMKFSKVVVNMLAMILEIKNKNCTNWSTGCYPTGAHSIYTITMKLSQVVGYMLAVVLEM